jgi:hypothetical protein
MTARATSTVAPDRADDPLAGIDWCCEWQSEAASQMFRQVKALCRVPQTSAEPPSAAMVATALQEAREILERMAEMEEPGEDEIDDECGAWDSSSFWQLCAEADARARAKLVSEDIQHARRLLDLPLERVWHEVNHVDGRAAASTLEALMLGLRERGPAALDEPAVRHRLLQLSDDKAIEIGARLRRLKLQPWTAEQVEALVQARERMK